MNYHEFPERPGARRHAGRVAARHAGIRRGAAPAAAAPAHQPKSPRQALQPEAAPPPPPRSQKARHPLVVVAELLPDDRRARRCLPAARRSISARSGSPSRVRWPSRQRAGRCAAPTSTPSRRSLQRQNVIDSEFVFTTAARMTEREDKLKAGEYLFQPGVSMQQVLDDLVTGRSVLHAIAFPEGLTSQKIVERLNADPVLTGEIAAVPPEGSLMPDTYKFTRGATRQQMLDQMQRAQARARRGGVGAARSRPAGRDAGGVRDARLDRGEGDGQGRRAAARRRRVHQPAARRHAPAIRSDGDLRPVRRRRASRPTGRSTGPTSTSRRPTTPTRSPACRRRRSPIRAARRWRRSPIRRAPTSSISWPTAPAAMPSPRRSTSTTAMSRAGGRSRQRRRGAAAAAKPPPRLQLPLTPEAERRPQADGSCRPPTLSSSCAVCLLSAGAAD